MTEAIPESRNEGLSRVWGVVSWALLLLVLLFLIVGIKPAMPDKVILLTGPRANSYHEMGERLAEDLRRRGLEVEVATTEGAFDNMELIEDQKDAIAFAPSIFNWKRLPNGPAGLETLGSVGVEPVWLFYRKELTVNRLSDLNGKTIATEGTKATSYLLAAALLKELGYEDSVELLPIPEETASRALDGLAGGTIDAVFLSGQANSTGIQSLIHYPDTKLYSVKRAKAYAQRVTGATVILAPEGVFDLARNVPSEDAQLLASATCLVADEDVHASLVPMVLTSVENIRNEDDSFGFISASQFPNSDHVTLPLASSANRYYRQGEVGLAKILPYQAVRYLNHLGFLVLPVMTLLVFALKAVPMVMRVTGSMKIKRWMKRLEAVEKAAATGAERDALLAELDRIDSGTADLVVPRSLVSEYIDFRQFLHDMRDRISA